MSAPSGIERVILVVLDGLRPDLITPDWLPCLSGLAASGSHTLAGTTVQPSVTAAALASLFTGVEPTVHGIVGETTLRPRLGHRLTLLPRDCATGGVPMVGHMRALPWGTRTLGTLLAAQLGMRTIFGGHEAEGILDRALPTLRAASRGVTVQTQSADYLHATCRTRVVRFVDDLELHLRAADGLIAVRSASRVGHSDLGTTRRRVESFRALLRSRGLVA